MIFEQAISLGPDCQTSFHIRRVFGRQGCPSGIFDSQVTPSDALRRYFESDLAGMFERDDLVHDEDFVRNVKIGTIHRHEFPTTIEAGYARAKARHLHLCDKIRKVMHGRRKTLFVVHANDPIETGRDLRQMIERINPRLDFHILAIKTCSLPATDPNEAWQGNHAYWSEALSSYKVVPSVWQQQIFRLTSHLRSGHF